MKARNKWRWSCAMIIIYLLVSGCQELRLLQFKSQLSNGRNLIVVSNENITFKKPILNQDDILTLSSLAPIDQAHSKQWVYSYIKQSIPSKPAAPSENLYLILNFNSNGLLEEITFPRQISQLISESTLYQAFSAIGNGVFTTNTSTVSSSKKINNGLVVDDLPTKQDVIKALGEPSDTTQDDDQKMTIYKYTYNVFGLRNNQAITVKPWLFLGFSSTNDALIYMETCLFGPLIEWHMPSRTNTSDWNVNIPNSSK